MAFGISEDKHAAHPPGTACMNDQSDVPREYEEIPKELLKHGTGRYSHVILVPQPSDPPNDPLNWSIWKKDCILLSTLKNLLALLLTWGPCRSLVTGDCAGAAQLVYSEMRYCQARLSTAVVGAFGPMLSPGFVVIVASLNISLPTLGQSTAWLIITIGLSLFIANPLAKKSGRRPVFIVAGCIMFACSIWGAFSKDYNSFLASRIIAGLGMAPYEVLVQNTIGDLYFVHQRATRVAVWNMFLLCGISGGSLISGYIIQDIGWKWTFGICAIFFGIFIFLIVLFVPETAYVRESVKDRLAGEHIHTANSEKATSHERPLDMSETRQSLPDPPAEDKESYLHSLRFTSGRKYTNAPFWKILIRPVVIFWYPAVTWAFLIYGVSLTWIVVFSVVNAQIFTLPPYNFSVSQTGLISLSPFIFTILGELIGGPLNDWICLYLTKKNRGIYEPEFRLVLMIPVLVLGIAGFFGFGATVHYQTHWSGPVLCFGLANMATAFESGCVFGYVIDSYEDLAEEAFVAINARNLLTFGLTYFVNSWLTKDGPLNVFNVLGSTFIAVVLLTIPLWIYGKRIRRSISRNAAFTAFMKD